jgi:hypothetical protein
VVSGWARCLDRIWPLCAATHQVWPARPVAVRVTENQWGAALLKGRRGTQEFDLRMDDARRAAWSGGGVWADPGASLLGPWDLDKARSINQRSLYAARLVQGHDGDWWLLGFRDIEDGAFVGEISDPIPVVLDGDTIKLAG